MATMNERFRETLQNLPEHETARAILLLKPFPSDPRSASKVQTRRPTRQERLEAMAQSERQVDAALQCVDEVLGLHGGRRTAPSLSGLGAIVVEASAAAILALAKLDSVSAVLEDQPIKHVTTTAG